MLTRIEKEWSVFDETPSGWVQEDRFTKKIWKNILNMPLRKEGNLVLFKNMISQEHRTRPRIFLFRSEFETHIKWAKNNMGNSLLKKEESCSERRLHHSQKSLISILDKIQKNNSLSYEEKMNEVVDVIIAACFNCHNNIALLKEEYKRVIDNLAQIHSKNFRFRDTLERNIDAVWGSVVGHLFCLKSYTINELGLSSKYVRKKNNYFCDSVVKQDNKDLIYLRPNSINFAMDVIRKSIQELYEIVKIIEKNISSNIEVTLYERYDLKFSYEIDFMEIVRKFHDECVPPLEEIKIEISDNTQLYFTLLVEKLLRWYGNLTGTIPPAYYSDDNLFVQFFKNICAMFEIKGISAFYKHEFLFRKAIEKYREELKSC